MGIYDNKWLRVSLSCKDESDGMNQIFQINQHFSELDRFLREYLTYNFDSPFDFDEMMDIYEREFDFIQWLSMEPCTSRDEYDQITCPNFRDGMCTA